MRYVVVKCVLGPPLPGQSPGCSGDLLSDLQIIVSHRPRIYPGLYLGCHKMNLIPEQGIPLTKVSRVVGLGLEDLCSRQWVPWTHPPQMSSKIQCYLDVHEFWDWWIFTLLIFENNESLVKFEARWILTERAFYCSIILFIWKWILTQKKKNKQKKTNQLGESSPNFIFPAVNLDPIVIQRCHISEFILNSEFFHSQFPQFYLFLARFGSICPNLRIFSEFLSGTHWHLWL